MCIFCIFQTEQLYLEQNNGFNNPLLGVRCILHWPLVSLELIIAKLQSKTLEKGRNSSLKFGLGITADRSTANQAF